MLLWTPFVKNEHAPLFRRLKELGFDGLEIPVNDGPDSHYGELGRMLDDIGLERIGVAFVTEDENPASPDPTMHCSRSIACRYQMSRYHTPSV